MSNHRRSRGGVVARMLAGAALAAVGALQASATPAGTPTYRIDFHVIGPGGGTLGNRCYRLSGTVAQIAPGYSSSSLYSLYAGFWSPSFGPAADEIFFNAFEDCRS